MPWPSGGDDDESKPINMCQNCPVRVSAGIAKCHHCHTPSSNNKRGEETMGLFTPDAAPKSAKLAIVQSLGVPKFEHYAALGGCFLCTSTLNLPPPLDGLCVLSSAHHRGPTERFSSLIFSPSPSVFHPACRRARSLSSSSSCDNASQFVG